MRLLIKSKTTAQKIKAVDLSCDIDNYTIIKTKNINEATFFVSPITAEKIKEKYTGRLKGYYITSYEKYIQKEYNNLDNNKLTDILKQDEYNIISKKEALTTFSDKEKNTLEGENTLEKKENKSNKRIIFTEKIRKRVYEKSNGRCEICNEPIPYDSFTIDHIIPLSKNGENKISNLQCACAACNNIKSNLTPLEFEEKIKKI